MKKTEKTLWLLVLITSFIQAALSQTFESLKNFTAPVDWNTYSNVDGIAPGSPPTLFDGYLYGSTTSGGIFGSGIIFKLNTNGTGFTVLKNFRSFTGNNGTNDGGSYPGLVANRFPSEELSLIPSAGGCLLVSNNFIYGNTPYGGLYGKGTIFKLNTDGTGFSVLKDFSAFSNGTNSDGANPTSGLVLIGNTLYGTTPSGGLYNGGVVFKINNDGTGFSVLKHFTNDVPRCTLINVGDTLYGTAIGSSDGGKVYKINTDGSGFTILKQFDNFPDGETPCSSLLLVSNWLFGTTCFGGNQNFGLIFRMNLDGSDYSVIHKFAGFPNDGKHPSANLTRTGDSIFGTTGFGGSHNLGVIFQMNLDGSEYKVLKNSVGDIFNGFTLSGEKNIIYGAAFSGGTYGSGLLFSLTPQPTSSGISLYSNSPVIFYPSQSGFNNVLQMTTNLNAPNWITITNALPVSGFLVTNVPGNAFFRLR